MADTALHPRTWRTSPAHRVLTGLAALSFLAVATILLLTQTAWSWRGGAVVLALFGLAGFADTMTARIELHEDALIVTRNLRRHCWPRDGFVAVTWARGSPVSLQRRDGRWLALPEVAGGPQALVNTLRAWLR